MTAVVLLHDLGVEEAGAPWRAAAPDGLARARPARPRRRRPRRATAHYDPMGPVTLARWALAGEGLVVGVRQNAHGALILAAGGGCDAVVIVDGLWGPWQHPHDAIDDMYAGLRALVADEAATAPPPPGLDPRTRHGYGVSVSPAFRRRFWGAVACPSSSSRRRPRPRRRASGPSAWLVRRPGDARRAPQRRPGIAVVAAVQAWPRP